MHLTTRSPNTGCTQASRSVTFKKSRVQTQMATLLLQGLSLITVVAARSSKPHILLMLADDLGYANVNWHNPNIRTPNLDVLVAEGIRLERHYVFQFCSPSRASLMSGRYPIHVQERMGPYWTTFTGPPTNMTLLPAKLREASYRVHHVGKWYVCTA